MGRMVKIGPISGYLGRPSGEGPWPTVLVIHEWYGLTNHIESIVDRFAGLHYFAFAPDLYHGEMALPGDSQKASSLVSEICSQLPSRTWKKPSMPSRVILIAPARWAAWVSALVDVCRWRSGSIDLLMRFVLFMVVACSSSSTSLEV